MDTQQRITRSHAVLHVVQACSTVHATAVHNRALLSRTVAVADEDKYDRFTVSLRIYKRHCTV
jgi:hypothetical protein